MSLVMLTNFTQTNGYIPTTALTTIKKDDDKVNIVASTEDVEETITRVRRLVELRDRIAEEGMSRATAAEFVKVAPEAVPMGFGLEMFTEIPTRVNMSYGTESIIATAFDQLVKLIKFLYEKLKKAAEWLFDAYQTLTGVKPTAYRMAQRTQYVEEMEKTIRVSLGIEVGAQIREELAAGMFDIPSATATIEGAFVDSTRVCDQLVKFNKPIAEIQRLVEAVTIESAFNIANVNAALSNANYSGDKIHQIITTAYNNDKSYESLKKALRNIATTLLSSNIYKSPGKDKRPIIDDLSSNEMKKLLDGLSAAVNKVEIYKPTPEDATDQTVLSDKDIKAILDELAHNDPSSMRDIRKWKDAVNNAKIKDVDNLDNMSVKEMQAKFLDKQAEISSAIEVSRALTVDFATTTIKFTAVRNNIKNTGIVKLVQTTLEEKALEKGNSVLETLQRAFKAYSANLAK